MIGRIDRKTKFVVTNFYRLSYGRVANCASSFSEALKLKDELQRAHPKVEYEIWGLRHI